MTEKNMKDQSHDICEDLKADHPLIVNSQKMTATMMIPKPWNNKALIKNDLLKMYIVDSFMRIFGISAEKDVSVKLMCPNPVYISVYRDLNELIETAYSNAKEHELKELFDTLVSQLRAIQRDTSEPVQYRYWTGLVPDLRTLTTRSDGLSWVYSVLVKGRKVIGCE